MFNQIIEEKYNQSSKEKLTIEERCEIFQKLNSSLFYAREELKDEKLNLILSWVKRSYMNCHDVTRELSNSIKCLNWQRCPGYLVQSSVQLPNPYSWSIDKSYKNCVVLKHHSIIKDYENNFFVECLPEIYPLKEYVFIPCCSALKGWSLKVGYS